MPFRRRTTRYRRNGKRPARATRYRRRSGYYPRIKGRRPTISRRRLLNITSKKKMDNMLPYSTNPDGSGGTPTSFGIPQSGGLFLWNATARDRVSSQGDANALALRESDTVFMRGLKERIVLTPNDSVSWMWRRITFTTKGATSIFAPIAHFIETSRGWNRLLVNSNSSTTSTAITSYIFDGASGTDWNDFMTAKVDTQRVTLKSDITKVIGSGNSFGRFHRYKYWYPMNKNFIYANDEQGETESTDVVHSLAKGGMGDYYVVDFFKCADPAGTHTLDFNPEATLYWHEK
uniref:Capsid protein n=1 Tax=Genomoviridae sp. TaxID=2202565 RepID=A0A858NF47_9VIRU|nr:MAG: capsid protein [Genomoviridae sp.]